VAQKRAPAKRIQAPGREHHMNWWSLAEWTMMRAPFLAATFLLGACAHQGAASNAPCEAALEARIGEELRVIDAGERIDATTEETARTPEQREAIGRASALMESHSRPVDAHDLAILDRAQASLRSESAWDRADDRVCAPDEVKLSLFCALQKASIEVLGEYDHRRASLQEVRFAVDEVARGRHYEHRLRDYNNDPTTTLADIHRVIAVARARVAQRLQTQCRG
jgi:hypothetical protein